MTHSRSRFPWLKLSLMISCLSIGSCLGCGSVRVTDTSRSAIEQLLLTSSWDTAILGVDFSPLTGATVVLDTKNLQGTDSGWMTYRIRESMVSQGVRLIDDPAEADYVLEAGAAVFATESTSSIIGIPSSGPVNTLASTQGVNLPEIALARRNRQFGVVRLALFARETETGRIVWQSGTVDADSSLKTISVLGLQHRTGTITHPADRDRRRHLPFVNPIKNR